MTIQVPLQQKERPRRGGGMGFGGMPMPITLAAASYIDVDDLDCAWKSLGGLEKMDAYGCPPAPPGCPPPCPPPCPQEAGRAAASSMYGAGSRHARPRATRAST